MNCNHSSYEIGLANKPENDEKGLIKGIDIVMDKKGVILKRNCTRAGVLSPIFNLLVSLRHWLPKIS